MDYVERVRAKRAVEKSVQEAMDEKMCRPGYRWYGEPLNRCLPAAVPVDYRPDVPEPDVPPPNEEPPPTPDEAVAAESKKRKTRS